MTNAGLCHKKEKKKERFFVLEKHKAIILGKMQMKYIK